jgi:hypothetical protein
MTTMRRRDSEKEEKAKVVDFPKRTSITRSESGTFDDSIVIKSAVKVGTWSVVFCSDLNIILLTKTHSSVLSMMNVSAPISFNLFCSLYTIRYASFDVVCLTRSDMKSYSCRKMNHHFTIIATTQCKYLSNTGNSKYKYLPVLLYEVLYNFSVNLILFFLSCFPFLFKF